MVFATPSEPIVSVIILAWRLTSGLIDCLKSLAESEDAPPFEVQLVLNGASPETRRIVAEHIRGAHLVDLDANVGYGGGCNAAAIRSRGKYLVLLNDDAMVRPDWLANLVAAAARSPRAGAIGSVLLNSDGTVQEAGSRVLKGAGTLQFGKGLTVDQATKAGYLSKRSIDYGSGAALLLRRDAFEKVGGFDPRYEPAYYEDVDLCFRLRLGGWDVILEPSAIVVHASGGSTDRDRRFRDFASRRSGTRFIERWAAVLAEAPDAGAPAKALAPVKLAGTITDAPTEIRDPLPSARTALDIAIAYQTWLNARLDAAEEEVIHERHFRLTDSQRIAELSEEATRLRTRLAGLESAGPIGILRWRLGIIRRQIRARRAIGAVKRSDSGTGA